jgi:hypothetical protein
MIFGHLPAGYITSKLLISTYQDSSLNAKVLMFWGLFGAIAPDIDLLYYFLIDPSQPAHHHHKYVTHFPIFWITLLLISLLWLRQNHNRSLNPVSAVIFTLNGFIHMALDTVTGHIFWLAPFINKPFSLIQNTSVTPNYFTHWTFALELLLIILAICVWNQSSVKTTRETKNPIS